MSKNLLIISFFIFLLAHNIYANACKKNCTKKSRVKRNSNGDPLIFVTTLCRHADRNIAQSYPNDPYQSVQKYWPEGYGQLTNTGKNQHYKLGQYFRERYASLLGDGSYNVSKVYVRSTDVDRVLMSAESDLAGLFPPSGAQVWNKKLDWQPVPVHTQPLADDSVLAVGKQCDRYNYLLLQYQKTSAYTDYFIRYAPLISYLEQNSGLKLPRILDINILYNTLWIERLKFKKIPEWAEKVMQPGGDFEMLALLLFDLFVPLPETRTLQSGYLLKEILDRSTTKSQGTLSPDRTLWMYFAHDNTITNMLHALNLYRPFAPPYASCLLFELYQGANGPYIELYYKKHLTPKIMEPLNIPNCGQRCPLANFYQLYADVLPTQSFTDECALEDGETLPPGVTSVFL